MPRVSVIRHNAKRLILTDPSLSVAAIKHKTGSTSEGSISTIRKDLFAFMSAGQEHLTPRFRDMIPKPKQSKLGDSERDQVNRMIWHNPKDAVAAKLATKNARDTLSASAESLEILRELGALKAEIELPILDDLIRINSELEDEAGELSRGDLIQRALKASESPPGRQSAKVHYYERNQYVSAAAKQLAEGCCDLCRESAPFQNNNGVPYLECHHVDPLAKGGKDILDNAVALCPNCHRQLHVCGSSLDKDRLHKRIEERRSDYV
jgi:5-methylcytosine-specific restriction endonuclease McrA